MYIHICIYTIVYISYSKTTNEPASENVYYYIAVYIHIYKFHIAKRQQGRLLTMFIYTCICTYMYTVYIHVYLIVKKKNRVDF